MRRTRTISLALALAALGTLPACTNMAAQGPSIQASELGSARVSLPVTIVSVRSVAVQGQSSWIGQGAGAAVGAIGGAQLGGGTGRYVGGILGALAGGVAGGAAEKAFSSQKALEITVRTKDGRELVVHQPDDGTTFSAGQQARLVTGNPSRIVP